MSIAETELKRVTEEYRRLREDLLPVFRMAKEGQPLPYHPAGNSNRSYNSYNYDASSTISPPAQTPSSNQSSGGLGSGGGLSRKFSTKKLFLGATPKNASPTHAQAPDRSMETALDPASAAERAVQSSSTLNATNGSQPATSPGYPSPNMPSPTSPPHVPTGQLASRSYRADQPTPSGRSVFTQNESDSHSSWNSRDSTLAASSRRAATPALDPPPGGSSAQSVEIFKSFRVSMEDPCHKVLPAALKKYNINAPWNEYALYIVYGNEERCLGLDEKPLILFKQLDKEGRKPMFMLRKVNPNHADGPGQGGPGSAGLDGTHSVGRSTHQGVSGNVPPGGII